MHRALNPAQVKAFFDGHRTVRQYKTTEEGLPIRMQPDELDAILHAAQRAPTDATAQLYSIIHLDKHSACRSMSELTQNAHLATCSEAFVICADERRVKRILEAGGIEGGKFPAIAVHFGIGDAVMAGTNLLIAAEMLGYQGCWIGGIMHNLEEIGKLLNLPKGVLPFAALCIGKSAEDTPYRPRLPRKLVIHTNTYLDGSQDELKGGISIMNPIAARKGKDGDWLRLLAAYFAKGGGMEIREPSLVEMLKNQDLWAGK